MASATARLCLRCVEAARFSAWSMSSSSEDCNRLRTAIGSPHCASRRLSMLEMGGSWNAPPAPSLLVWRLGG